MKRLTFTKTPGILAIGLSAPFVWDFRPALGILRKRLARSTANTIREATATGENGNVLGYSGPAMGMRDAGYVGGERSSF
jgi:hypothetical protein